MLPPVPTSATSIATGILQGVTSATRLPSVKCKYFLVKARAANTGRIAIGKDTVTVDGTTTDTTNGLEIEPGGSEFFFGDMDLYYRKCSGTGDHCTYIAYA